MSIKNGTSVTVADSDSIKTVALSNRDAYPGKSLSPGCGTVEEPYIVDWDEEDPENPFRWSFARKWNIVIQQTVGTFIVAFSSSAYSGGIRAIEVDLHTSQELAILGISLYVVGFGLGPILFAPLSEMYGRRWVYMIIWLGFTLFQIGCGAANNIQTMLACRLLAGICGTVMFTNSPGFFADMFSAKDRFYPVAVYSTSTLLGPAIGPIAGGYIIENHGLTWRYIFWFTVIVAGINLVWGFFISSETYAPVLLHRRARKLAKASNGTLHYVSKYDTRTHASFVKTINTNLQRTLIYLVTEPIVTLLAIYVSLAYAMLYAFFTAFPVVFQDQRHWTPGQGGLAFLGVGVGMILSTVTVPIQLRLYVKAAEASPNGIAKPESKLYGLMLGGIMLPIGLFWFAWTSKPTVHWIVPILSGIPCAIGIIEILRGVTSYVIDSYGKYAASAVGATVTLRSLSAAAFPLFIPAMYRALGDAWAGSVFAFLALACMPVPFLFYRYGPWIRSKSKLAVHDDEIDGFPERPAAPVSVDRDSEQGSEKV